MKLFQLFLDILFDCKLFSNEEKELENFSINLHKNSNSNNFSGLLSQTPKFINYNENKLCSFPSLSENNYKPEIIVKTIKSMFLDILFEVLVYYYSEPLEKLFICSSINYSNFEIFLTDLVHEILFSANSGLYDLLIMVYSQKNSSNIDLYEKICNENTDESTFFI